MVPAFAATNTSVLELPHTELKYRDVPLFMDFHELPSYLRIRPCSPTTNISLELVPQMEFRFFRVPLGMVLHVSPSRWRMTP
jgi:hypothetical protein